MQFDDDFYMAGPWYQVLHDKEYERLETHIPHRHLLSFDTASSPDQAPREPPQPTSRGLRVSFPLRKPKASNLPSVAWIYCKLAGQLLCILLQHSSSSSQLLGRHSASWLISVDASTINEFELTELCLRPNGTFEESPMSPLPNSYSLEPWGRVKVKLPDITSGYVTHVVSAYPYKSWSIEEFFFRGDPAVIGVLLFECVHEQQSVHFAVFIGAYRGHPWCDVLEEPDYDENTLNFLFQDISMISDSEILRHRSDRTAIIASPGLFFSAAMRKSPAMEDHIAIYELKVSSCEVKQPNIWINLHMFKQQSLIAHLLKNVRGNVKGV